MDDPEIVASAIAYRQNNPPPAPPAGQDPAMDPEKAGAKDGEPDPDGDGKMKPAGGKKDKEPLD
jgi:hypothetical protein